MPNPDFRIPDSLDDNNRDIVMAKFMQYVQGAFQNVQGEFDDIGHILKGNGGPGLCKRVEALEKERDERTGSSRGVAKTWQIIVAVLSIAALYVIPLIPKVIKAIFK